METTKKIEKCKISTTKKLEQFFLMNQN